MTRKNIWTIFWRLCGLEITTQPPCFQINRPRFRLQIIDIFEQKSGKTRNKKRQNEQSYLWRTTTTWPTSRVRPSLEKRLLGETERLRAHFRFRHFLLGSASVTSGGFVTLESGRKLLPPAMIPTLITAPDRGGTWGHRRQGGAGHLWLTTEPTNERTWQVQGRGYEIEQVDDAHGSEVRNFLEPRKSLLLLIYEVFVDLL